MRVIAGGPILLDEGPTDGHALVVVDGRIAAVLPEGEVPAGGEHVDLDGATLAPGFIDTQVNGGGGLLFNDAPTVDTIRTIGAAHRRFGTTGFLPTLISDDLAVVEQAVAAVEAAIEAGVPGVLGIHIEGPFLNVARHGIHDPARIRAIDEAGLSAVTRLRHGVTLVTLAPERTGVAAVARLATAGVIVAGGHSDATHAEFVAAVDAGISGVTHLFNAMSPLLNRAPGVTGAALDDDRVTCGLIVDGLHVHPAAMRVALRCAGAERIMLVTDGMPSVGSPEKRFTLQGHEVRVVGGACYNDDGTLAGSDLDMATAVRNARTMLGVDLATAVRMASAVPADFLRLGRERGRIRAGLAADLVALDGEGQVVASWIGGVGGDC